MKLDSIKALDLEHTKTSEDELERRRIYYQAIDNLISKKFDFLAKTDPAGASNFLNYNPINKAINFLQAFPNLEFDTPDAKRYTVLSKYAEHKKALEENGYGFTIDRMGKAGKSEVNEISMLYILQRRFIKIVENRPVVNSLRSGYNHLLHGDSINELIGSTGLDPKLGKKLAEMCAYSFDPLIAETDGAELVSVPETFDYNHYRFADGVLNARTGEFIKGDRTTVCMHEIEQPYGYSDLSASIFEKLLDYMATEDGQVNPVKRKQILGFMLYPVSYNPIDKDVCVLFGSGGNGKSVLGDLMSLAYGSIGTADSFLKASKKADGSYKNIEITRAFSKNCIRFDEETFSHIDQAEQMKNFVNQKITYEKRDLQSVAVELYIRGIVILNSNTTGVVGASRANTWFTRRFKAINFKFVFDQDPEAKAWIKMATTNYNGLYVNYTQGDILSWLMEQRKKFTPEELEHPLPNVADVLALGDDVDEGDLITDIIRRNSSCYKELQAYFNALPDSTTVFPNMDNVRGVWLSKNLCREIGSALGEPKINREKVTKLINTITDDLIVYNSKSRAYVLYEDCNFPELPTEPEPTKRDEIIKQVAEDEGMLAETPKAVTELAMLELDKLKSEYEQVVPEEAETSQEASYELSIITNTSNGYVTNETPTEKVVTDIHDIVFPASGNKATMPKVFPDNRETRGDYSKKSSLMVLDFDHLPAFTIQEVLDKLKSLNMKMFVQESYRSAPMDFGVHVFFPMTKALVADEWNLYRDLLGEKILDETGLQFDTGHAGFRGVINGSFHEIIDIDGELATPPAGLEYLLGRKSQNTEKEPWTADRLTVPMYLGMDNKIARAVKDIYETRDLNIVDGERNSTVFMLSNDLVSMQNRGAFQNGVFDELWNTLADIITDSCTPSDASEFLGVMSRAQRNLEV